MKQTGPVLSGWTLGLRAGTAHSLPGDWNPRLHFLEQHRKCPLELPGIRSPGLSHGVYL